MGLPLGRWRKRSKKHLQWSKSRPHSLHCCNHSENRKPSKTRLPGPVAATFPTSMTTADPHDLPTSITTAHSPLTASAVQESTAAAVSAPAPVVTVPLDRVPTPTNSYHSSNSARNTESGLVFGIIDRMDSVSGCLYRVQWCDEPDGFRWEDTWEPGRSFARGRF